MAFPDISRLTKCTVTLKDPIERGLKGHIVPAVVQMLFHSYTQRPDRKGTESDAGGSKTMTCYAVTLKDPIERGLKGAAVLKNPILLVVGYTQRPDRKGTERSLFRSQRR